MLQRLIRAWSRASRLVLARKIWRRPKRRDVLVFDAVGLDILLEFFGTWRPEVLHVRGEQINIPVLLASLVRPGDKAQAYFDAYIEFVKPRVIVTYIDNDIHFMSLKRRHPDVKAVIVQNGWKSFYADVFEVFHGLTPSDRARLGVDYLLTFGDVIGQEYSRHIGGKVIPVGSLKNNHVVSSGSSTPGTITFISQWHRDGFSLAGKFCPHEAFFRQVDHLILQCLVKYAEENARYLMVALRNGETSSERQLEEAYFRSIVGDNCRFSPRNGPFPSYAAVDASEVVVAVDTTLGYESIARGRKAAIFSIRSAMLGVAGLTYGWPGNYPPEGPFWTNRPDPDSFVRILDYLFAVDQDQWRADVKATGFDALMIYNPGNSLLKSIIKEELGLEPHLSPGRQ